MLLKHRDFRLKLLVGALFSLIYFIVFGISSYASGFEHHRFLISFSFEKNIPFYPSWSIIYLSINLFLLLSLIVYDKWQPLAALALTLLCETLIAGLLFILFPTQLSYSPTNIVNNFVTITHIATYVSLKNNYFPSLHTAFAVTAALAYSQHCRSLIIKIAFFIWAILIPVATLLIHEHQLLDILAGAILAVVSYHWILPKIQNWLGSANISSLQAEKH